MTTTTLAPSVIEGIDMESVPKCTAPKGGCEGAASWVIVIPCGHHCLSCEAHLPLFRRWLDNARSPVCHHCRVPVADFTVVPL